MTRMAQVCLSSHCGHYPSTQLPEIGWNTANSTALVCHMDVPCHLTEPSTNYLSFALLILKQIRFSTFKNNMNAQWEELILYFYVY